VVSRYTLSLAAALVKLPSLAMARKAAMSLRSVRAIMQAIFKAAR
jgi:hypothetical protein